MKIHQLLSLLIKSGVVVEMETNEFFLSMPAIAPWARKALDDLSTCEHEPGVQLRCSFELHKKKWQRETANLSGRLEEHESYRAIIALDKKRVDAVMCELTPGSLKVLMRFRRNKFRKEDQKWLNFGSYLTMRIGRNGNDKMMSTVSVSRKLWTREEIERAKLEANRYAYFFAAPFVDSETAGDHL